jgi:Arylsulfotransferase (ASST)
LRCSRFSSVDSFRGFSHGVNHAHRLPACGEPQLEVSFALVEKNDRDHMATKVVKANLTSYGGGSHGAYVDFEVQEINLRSGKLVFAWDMAKHVPLSASIVTAPTSAGQVWDAYHLSSIDESQNGALLLSARDTWAVYDVSNPAIPGGGQVLWQLGGKPESQWHQFSISNDITGPYDSAFQWQHDAQFQPVAGNRPPGQVQLSVFDDACCDSPYADPFSPAQGEILNLDFSNMTASVQQSYPHDPALFPNTAAESERLNRLDRVEDIAAVWSFGDATAAGQGFAENTLRVAVGVVCFGARLTICGC